jgi:hypothetical protein
MQEPFGKRNRKPADKPAAVTPARRRPQATQPRSANSKLYFYIIGGVLFLMLAGYAFSA